MTTFWNDVASLYVSADWNALNRPGQSSLVIDYVCYVNMLDAKMLISILISKPAFQASSAQCPCLCVNLAMRSAVFSQVQSEDCYQNIAMGRWSKPPQTASRL